MCIRKWKPISVKLIQDSRNLRITAFYFWQKYRQQWTSSAYWFNDHEMIELEEKLNIELSDQLTNVSNLTFAAKFMEKMKRIQSSKTIIVEWWSNAKPTTNGFHSTQTLISVNKCWRQLNFRKYANTYFFKVPM